MFADVAFEPNGPELLLETFDAPLDPDCVAKGLTISGTTVFDIG